MNFLKAWTTKKIRIVIIKPSKYDDEGYVIRHFRGVLPSNTLACLSSLTQDVARRELLGKDVELVTITSLSAFTSVEQLM